MENKEHTTNLSHEAPQRPGTQEKNILRFPLGLGERNRMEKTRRATKRKIDLTLRKS